MYINFLYIGNLVTMEWWTHLWLNEGFASFMENTCTHALFPEYDIWTQVCHRNRTKHTTNLQNM